MGFSVLKVAEVARVDLAEFSLTGKTGARFPLRRPARAEGGLSASRYLPKCEVSKHIDQLRTVSDAWLAHKSGSEKGFSLGAFSPDYLKEFDCAVMCDDTGILAFANIWRGADKRRDVGRHDALLAAAVGHPDGRNVRATAPLRERGWL